SEEGSKDRGDRILFSRTYKFHLSATDIKPSKKGWAVLRFQETDDLQQQALNKAKEFNVQNDSWGLHEFKEFVLFKRIIINEKPLEFLARADLWPLKNYVEQESQLPRTMLKREISCLAQMAKILDVLHKREFVCKKNFLSKIIIQCKHPAHLFLRNEDRV